MSWAVARKQIQGGRFTKWLLIDGEDLVAELDNEPQARAIASTLNGADKPYRAELAKQKAEPF